MSGGRCNRAAVCGQQRLRAGRGRCSGGRHNGLQLSGGVHLAAIVGGSSNGVLNDQQVAGRDACDVQRLEIQEVGGCATGSTCEDGVNCVHQHLKPCGSIAEVAGQCIQHGIDGCQIGRADPGDAGIGIVDDCGCSAAAASGIAGQCGLG